MPDANYAANYTIAGPNSNGNGTSESSDTARTTSSVTITSLSAGSFYDSTQNNVAIFR
jgi:hypothetical protein